VAKSKLTKIDFPSRRALFLRALPLALQRFDTKATFTGPSLHFHLTSLEAARKGDIDRFIEQVYALLPSWGMHRMGPSGPKMLEFEVFRASVLSVEADLRSLAEKEPSTMDRGGWERLERVFRSIRCMRTSVHLIGNSKVLAHWLPALVPPIDREYTLAYFPYRGDIRGLDNGWNIMEILLREFFYPVLADPAFLAFSTDRLNLVSRDSWHTSALKIIDNALIGFVAEGTKA
jgi:hypothetical protein